MGARSKWLIQDDRKTSRISNKFSTLKCYSLKTDVWIEFTKTKELHASKYLICKILLEWKCPSSFNDKFHPSKLPLNHTTRSWSTYQLKVNNFNTERFGHKSVVKKCTLIRLEQPPKNIKTKLPNDEEIRPWN